MTKTQEQQIQESYGTAQNWGYVEVALPAARARSESIGESLAYCLGWELSVHRVMRLVEADRRFAHLPDEIQTEMLWGHFQFQETINNKN